MHFSRRFLAFSTAAVTAVGLLGACSIIEGDGTSASRDDQSESRDRAAAEPGKAAKPVSELRLSLNVPVRASAPVSVEHGAGREPGTTYRVVASGEDSARVYNSMKRTFRTADVTLDDQTFASITPLDGESVGVGMPVIETFDVPVTDRAEIERHLDVQSSPDPGGP